MSRLALAAVPLAVIVALVLAVAIASQTDTPTPTPQPSQSASPSPSPSPEPAPTPTNPPAIEPTPLLDPAYPGTLRPGDWVQITGTGSCLNMRYQPLVPVPTQDGRITDNVLNCLPDGFVGRLTADGSVSRPSIPVQADGRWWWHIVGQGWAADEFLAFHHQGGLPFPQRPDLANAGLVAYIRDYTLWLMNADGSNARQIFVGAINSVGVNESIETFEWSPSADRIAVGLRSHGILLTKIIDLDGVVLLEIPGVGYPRWSPDGGRLAGIRTTYIGTPYVYTAQPVVFEIATGREWAVGPATYGYAGVVWNPDGGSLAFLCASGYAPQPDGTVVAVESASCHGDGLRVVSADGSGPRVLVPNEVGSDWFLSSPSWSPSGDTIALTSAPGPEGGRCWGYVLIDAASGALTDCVSPPEPIRTGDHGGGFGIGDSSWMPDGRLVFAAHGVGQSGILTHDLVTGARRIVPSMIPGPASFSPDGSNLTFATNRDIWVAGVDGSNLTLVAQGWNPAWQPRP